MENIIRAVFNCNEYNTTAARPDGKPIYQYNYGQILQIHGLDLQKAVEIHFSYGMGSSDAIIRIGTTADKVTEVAVPEKFLEAYGTVTAYIYVSDTESGQTEYKIRFQIVQRAKPEAWDSPEDGELFREAIEAVNESADRAEDAAVRAEVSAGNAGQSAEIAKEIPGQVEEGKRNIDDYVAGKELELKGDTGNVYFTSFRVVNGRLKMYSDPSVTKIVFRRAGSRLKYRIATGG